MIEYYRYSNDLMFFGLVIKLVVERPLSAALVVARKDDSRVRIKSFKGNIPFGMHLHPEITPATCISARPSPVCAHFVIIGHL